MYALEFETEVKNGRILIPTATKFNFQHVKVILLAEQTFQKEDKPSTSQIDFTKYKVNCFNDIDPVKYQREIRDEL